jgi:hypothetical protein
MTGRARGKGIRLVSPSEDNFRKRFFELVGDRTDAETARLLDVDRSYIAHLRAGRRFSEAMKARATAVWPELVHYVALDMMLPRDGAA